MNRTGLSTEDVAELRHLETSLWRSGTRFDRDYMDSILADDFVEFGRSGKRYDRAAILDSPDQPIDVELPLQNFTATLLASGVALVTYRSVVSYEEVERANRSSVWTMHDGRWLLRFHQGTPTD